MAVPHAVTGWPVWLPQAGIADRTAMVAGSVAAGGQARLEPVLNTSIVRAGELTLARTGLAWDEAVEYATEEEIGQVSVHGSSCERTLSASQPLAIDMIYHRGDGRILGAEVAGKAGADKRVDVLSAAILGGMTVERISALDLAYAPAVLHRARRGQRRGMGRRRRAGRPGPAVDDARAGLAARLGGHRRRGARARPRRARSPTPWSSRSPSCAATSPRCRGTARWCS